MKRKSFLLLFLFLTGIFSVNTQRTYSIVIKGGHVIDPENNIDEVMDGVKEGKIALVAKDIETDKKPECEMIFRDGSIVYDLNSIANPVVAPFDQRSGTGTGDGFAEWYKSKPVSNGLHLTPSGSINQQEFFRQYKKNPKWWDEAIDFLNNKDLLQMKPGVYVIDSGNVIATIAEGPALNIGDIKWESHRYFNDLQYIIRGNVKMGVSPVDNPDAVVTVPYKADGDIMHYTNESGRYYDAGPDTFFIFSPLEMHRPSIKISGNKPVKKIVIKVRVP